MTRLNELINVDYQSGEDLRKGHYFACHQSTSLGFVAFLQRKKHTNTLLIIEKCVKIRFLDQLRGKFTPGIVFISL